MPSPPTNPRATTKPAASNIAIERARKTLLSVLEFNFMTFSWHA
jgi:hypothetical protein